MQRLKLRSERGETLIEVLASVLIVSLSVMMVAGSVMASSRVDVDAKKMDKTHYAALSNAETHTTATSDTGVKVTISDDPDDITKGKTFDITFYGNAGAGMFSYERAK